MPLWHLYHPVDAFTDQEKRQIADSITDIYEETVKLPRFYAVVLFHEVERSSFYVGGEPAEDLVRVVVEHIAIHVDDPSIRVAMRQLFSDVIRPFVEGKRLHWEFHIDETPRDLWMIDGLVPPPTGSDAEKMWAKENHAVPY